VIEREALPAFFVTAARGTELALKDELRELGMRKVRADRGGVRFLGTHEDALHVCLASRIAVRVLFALHSAPARNQDELYEAARTIEWERVLSARHTLAVSAVSKDEALRHTGFVSMKVKDAIVDRLRDRFGQRPDVDRDDPDVGVFVHVARGTASFYADVSGRSLHERGYRRRIGDAPLKETLAAAMLRLSGWDRRSPLVDPMCGSGTIAIEADLWARDVAPGLSHARFGIERWADHDAARAASFAAVRDRLRAAARSDGAIVFASDVDPRAIDAAQKNATDARAHVRFALARAADAPLPGPGSLIIANPPYGVRIGGEAEALDDLVALARRARPARLALLTERAAKLPLTPVAAFPLSNGAIDVTLSVFDAPVRG
jgi:putative N6-adenine-specific DNA methylase